MKTIPESFGNLTKLKVLSMFECEALEDFPLGVSNLSALEKLNFARCRALKTIPKSFCNLKGLKMLRMFECGALEELHVGVTNLLALE